MRTLSCLSALLWAATTPFASAGSATWSTNPVSGDWNTATSWMPNTVPNSETDVATFGQSNVTAIAVHQTVVGGLVFSPEASAYTFTLSEPTDVAYFAFYGEGVINNSPNEQTFVFPSNFIYGVNVQFRNTATAGDRVTYYAANAGSGMFFAESANAGSATFINTSYVDFYGAGTSTPSAANATIINDGGRATFSYGGTAGNAVITNQSGGSTEGDAGNATITNQGTATRGEYPSHTFVDSADTATIINNPATIDGGQGGYTFYAGTDASQSPTIISNGSSFADGASAGRTFITGSAGNATLIAHGGTNGGAGGEIVFKNYPGDGDTARIELDGNALLDISLRTPPGVSIGSVEGDGAIYLGANNLGIGANSLSTQFDGQIQDGGRMNLPGGSITKIGSGTLTLTGASTYTGGTTVNSGVLLVNSTLGSGTGTGNLQVDTGTLGGTGTVFGAVTIGTGSGAGASLQPGFGKNKPVTLTLQSTLTFKGDSTYTASLNTRKPRTDMVLAKGVTIQAGAEFNLMTIGDGILHLGRVLKVVSNTAATAISGTFANLMDGSTVTVGMNKFQVSYKGGDGNDLTLTVVP